MVGKSSRCSAHLVGNALKYGNERPQCKWLLAPRPHELFDDIYSFGIRTVLIDPASGNDMTVFLPNR